MTIEDARSIRAALPGRRRRLQGGLTIATALGLVAVGATSAIGAVTTPNTDTLKSVGPTGPYGFPVYYEDAEGLKLEQCLDANEPMCDPAFLIEEGLDPNLPLAVDNDHTKSNFPVESFYFQGGAIADMPGGGDASLTLALEATFANEDPRNGDQVVFGRLRIRVDTPTTGTYTVTHPYGVDTFEVTDAEDGINMTEDITPAPGNFGLAMRSRIAPFLTPAGTAPVKTDTGTYIADPAVATKVKGSPYDTNFFEVKGPDGQVVATTDEFNLLGKISTNNGISPISATVSEDEGGTFLNVHATAGVDDAVTVSGGGIPETTLAAGGDGTAYFARIPVETVPSEVTIRNESDAPVAEKKLKVTDLVAISGATYDVESQELKIAATSSDQIDAPELKYGDTPLVGGSLTLTEVPVPPASVTVTSTGGGSDTAPVRITGGELGQQEATTAVVVAPKNVFPGDEVVLDGSSSVNATSFQWTQTGGDTVQLTGADTARATFTAPASGELKFTLTTKGTSEATSEITIAVTAADTAPTAAASATPTNALVGQTVTLDGSGSTNAKDYVWTQKSGPAVQLTGATTAKPTFVMPAAREPITFELVVKSPTATASAPATVSVSANLDTITVTSAELRTGKNEWRISGTSAMTNLNTVTVWTKTSTGQKGVQLGTATVEPPAAGETAGSWTIRNRGTAAPAGTTGLIVESSKGGLLTDVTYTTRR
ncbi:PKD domain-containing protein [Herbiconiux sp. SYSU D00978]|uniref:PKD domain-containing protein n=1 Tax=Herbiconiux sp. SYSU D00978 TaxID=2812562 RepID=UPI001A9782D7|nr:hypothetical protein [Herbiconiux sp. SYSU D00978]